ncbi:oligosaccharyl transferase, archaeosortase A system-associated [Salarchaeum sp. JOR-1]|uniref:oligosaccharyl transferase, archaeosortase A system-associated n=1 Tax=Salarchaeum sp. JOR-1 TaxID=2599399 RepID=UPI001198A5F4|nr:oligosaccharyl transferase, archaeosortase A system-associated [Salarchaeum sp. JOR-1]QDX41035.1 oligosaccharyl transferase, archaeosortase A system-associated [Salarchaeum sp. JOR-1]
MSDDGDQSGEALQRAGDWLKQYYQYPTLALVLAFMFWVRAKSWEAFTRGGEVFFSGNDAWYHYRMVQYTVGHWPATMPFDPWTGFPFGTSVGQFGTLFDQLIATAALIVGLGSPSEKTVALSVLFAPPVFGTLITIPTYFIGKRLSGRLGGVIAAVVLGLLPGLFLSRSLVGSADHNIAEPLFMSLAVLAMMVALSVAERERPVWEQVAEREFAALRKPLGWSVLAGIATALYLYVWPPGVLLVGIFGVFFVVQLSSDYYNDTSPDHVAFVGAVSMTTTGLLALLPFGVTSFSASQPGPLQPLFAFAVAFGAAFMAWLARQWDTKNLDTALYPVTVGGVILAGAGVVAVAIPSLFSMVQSNLLRFVGFSAGAAQRTISEAQPFLAQASRYGISDFAVIFLDYGLTFFIAVFAGAWLLWRPTLRSRNLRRVGFVAASALVVLVMLAFPGLMQGVGEFVGVQSQLIGVAIVGLIIAVSAIMDDRPAEHLLIVVWGVFLTSAAFTQVRFNYYLAVPVAVLSGFAAVELLRMVGTGASAAQRLEDVDASQVFAVALVVLVLIVPLAVPFTFQSTQYGNISSSTAVDTGNTGPSSSVLAWDSMLDWMNENTPAEGNFNNAGNADQLDYYGTYGKTDDFQYPNGSYGVMSWWDYGHWITVEGERIPNANPFQQGATTAANYLLSQNETVANNILQELGSPGEETRYVAVDWQMASLNAKFSAPTVFANNVSAYDFYSPLYVLNSQNQVQQQVQLRSQAYYESMMVRLYRYHGSRVEATGTTVLDWDRNIALSDGGYLRVYQPSGENDSVTKSFETRAAAKAFVANDTTSQGQPTSQIGGLGGTPVEDVNALQHYRLVGTSEASVSFQQILRGSQFRNLPSAVKLFERVPGATVHGTGPANTTVTASVTLEATTYQGNQLIGNQTTYTQQVRTGPDGEFTMTLPYSTTGYDNWGPQNGHTNVSVRASGPYTFSTPAVVNDSAFTVTYNATAHVSEAAVIGETESAVAVELTKEVLDVPGGAQNDSETNTTNDTNTSSLVSPSTLDAVETDGDASTTTAVASVDTTAFVARPV